MLRAGTPPRSHMGQPKSNVFHRYDAMMYGWRAIVPHWYSCVFVWNVSG